MKNNKFVWLFTTYPQVSEGKSDEVLVKTTDHKLHVAVWSGSCWSDTEGNVLSEDVVCWAAIKDVPATSVPMRIVRRCL